MNLEPLTRTMNNEPRFRINDIVLDTTTKDYVLITNGIPVVVDGKETRDIMPTEGIVIRSCLGDGLFWAYITIQGHRLHPTRVAREEWDETFKTTQGRI